MRIGDYRIERELHREDTGVVYLGAHLVLPRRASIKVANDRGLGIQLLREACILEALSHPGIPRVYECGVLERTPQLFGGAAPVVDDRRPWSAQQYVDGHAIAAPIPVAELTTVVRDVAEILAHAHGRGITHGGVDRDAVVRTPGARFPLCLRNWGEASTLDTEARTPIDPREDVRMLGALALEVLSGTRSTAGAAETCPWAPVELTALLDRMLDDSDLTASELHEQASWLAATIELIPTKPRWTPAYGLGDRSPTEPEFQIRISRTPTS